MGNFHNQWYSDVIVYDERKRYYYTWARKNKPHLDDEIKNESIANLDQVRRAVQHTFGNVGTSESVYSSENSGYVGATDAFKVMAATVANGGSGTQYQNFLVKGGSGDQSTEYNTEHPAVLFARGFYIFLRGNIEYNNQNNLGSYLANNYTETLIPDLTDPAPGIERVDIVYADLHFSEASAVSGSDPSEYTDTNLKNPIVGTETASRARAVFDIRVWEDWRFKDIDGSSRSGVNQVIDQNIFNHSDFLGDIDTVLISDTNPVNHHYRIPLAVIYRKGSQDIADTDIVDLLDLYGKRIYTQEEITHRFSHGGFTLKEVNETLLNSSEVGFSGLFNARWEYAKLDEGAYATGSNQGLGTESFNTNSVTPRVLDTYGKFAMDGLLIGGVTGIATGPLDSVTGPVELHSGELVANELSVKSVYVGYDVGITGNREYSDRVNVTMSGITGAAGIAIINDTGETGAVSFRITGAEYFTHVDYKGRHGIGTDMPGWTGPDEVWNTIRYSGSDDAVEITHDNAESARIKKHLFVGKDVSIGGNAQGESWKIPNVIDRDNPALFGFTGIPQIGVTESAASFQVVPGIAVMGVTGSLRGYTGSFGFYEAYDPVSGRVFTIGSRGDNFDRQVLSLYGTSPRDCYISDADFMDLPGSLVSTELTVGDEVSYDIVLEDDSHVTGAVTVTSAGVSGLQEIADHINFIAGFCETGITYTYYKAKEWGDTGAPDTVTKTDGVRLGAQVCYEGELDSLYLHIVVKSMPELDLTVSDVSMIVDRTGYDPETIDFIDAGYYGSGGYGGDILDLNFLKLDLGEAADAWLFNGDVFFNGNGLLNRVTFSPNVLFRDDVFVYGKLSAQELLLSSANITDLNVDKNLGVGNYLSVYEGFALGYESSARDGFRVLDLMFADSSLDKFHLVGTVNGGLRASNVYLKPGEELNYQDSGVIWQLNKTSSLVDIFVTMNGTYDDEDWPFGIHLVDRRQDEGITKFSTLVIDAHDYSGDPPDKIAAKLWVKGNIEVGVIENGNLLGGDALIRRLTLGASVTEIDSAYALSLKGGSAYIQNLTVSTLKYDVDNISGISNFYEPQNITTVERGIGERTSIYNKNEGIIRSKEFSLDAISGAKVNLRNNNALGTETDYRDFSASVPKGTWALDTCSFSRRVVEKYSVQRGDDTIKSDQDFNVVEIDKDLSNIDILPWEYYRNWFSRIILMKVGQIKMVWKGYSSSSSGGNDVAGGVIIPNLANVETYEFSSNLFKTSDQNVNVFDWSVVPADVNILNLRGSFNDRTFASNLLYNMSGSLGLYIPLDRWTAYEVKNSDNYFERFMYFRYTNRVQNYHSLEVTQQTTVSEWDSNRTVWGNWEVAVYPKIYQQRLLSGTSAAASSDERLYEVIWDLNVVLYPYSVGSCSNLVGDIRISYM